MGMSGASGDRMKAHPTSNAYAVTTIGLTVSVHGHAVASSDDIVRIGVK